MRRRGHGRARWAALIAIVIGLAAGGIAYASIPDSSGVIHGCYARKDGSLRAINTDAGATCSAKENSLTWNQTFLVGSSGTIAIGPSSDSVVGFGSAGSVETEAAMPVSGTHGHLYATIDRTPLSGSVQVVLRLNGAATGISCTITSGRRCWDTSDTAEFSEGDLADATVANNTTNDIYVTWSVRTG